MVNRHIYDEMIDKLKEVYSHHEGLDFEEFMRQMTEIRDNFDIKLMLVGHFSAGKSSLLNMLLQMPNFLKEAQEPKTAIATELRYGENESAYAYDMDGNKEKINSEQEYFPQKYSHLEYTMNSSVLKEIKDFTIVDTPGYDVNVMAHTRALNNYIGKGSAYLVVVDQEKGGLDETTFEFIQEISNYSSQIAILINKCDKIPPEIAENIAESTKFTLEMYGYDYKVYTISKRDTDIVEKLISIISSFDAQVAFNKAMTRRLKLELSNLEKVLLMIQKNIFLDTYDLDESIKKYSRISSLFI